MTFIYLVNKYYFPPPPQSSTDNSDTMKSARGTNSETLKSPRSRKPTPLSKSKEVQPEKEPEPPKPLEEVILLNFDMDKIIVLLDKIKEMCCFQDVENLDLANFKTGECAMIHLNPFESGSKYLKKGEKYFPCKVIIQQQKPSTPPQVTVDSKKKSNPTPTLPEIEKSFISLVSGDASDQVPTILDPTKKPQNTKKK